MDPRDAQEALDQISETKRVVAQRSSAPSGYYAVLGLAVALLTISASAPQPWMIIGITAGAILVGVSIGWYRSSVDTWSWGDLRGKGSWIFWIMAITMLGCYATSALVRWLPLSIALGVLVLGVMSILGPMWDRAYVAQVQERR